MLGRRATRRALCKRYVLLLSITLGTGIGALAGPAGVSEAGMFPAPRLLSSTPYPGTSSRDVSASLGGYAWTIQDQDGEYQLRYWAPTGGILASTQVDIPLVHLAALSDSSAVVIEALPVSGSVRCRIVKG